MYIEIQDGISLNLSCIEGIEKIDDIKCKVYTHHRAYVAMFPYVTLLGMLQQDNVISKNQAVDMKSTMIKLDKVLNSSQHFVG